MKPRCWLLLGPLLFCILDGALTLQGQSHEYWEGRFDLAEEMNPLGLWPLQRGPSVFAIALLCWITVFCLGIVLLPENLARPLAFAVQLGHSLGAASWLTRHGIIGWLALIVLLLSSRIILDRTWAQYDRARQRQTA
jgi:hypothetical protein